MTDPATTEQLSAREFLDWEAKQPEKHELLQGQILAMVGVTRQHATVTGNLFAWLMQRLRGTDCRVYMADMMLKLEAAEAFFYPDLFVTCAEADHRAHRFMTQPRLIVEVLSESTEAYDRGEKFALYRQFPTLAEYLLIDPVRLRAEIFRRNATGHWVLHEYSGDNPVLLTSLELAIEPALLYENLP